MIIIWKHPEVYRDEPKATLANFKLFKSKVKTTGKTTDPVNTKNVIISETLKYLSNFWVTLEIPLISSEISI